MTENRSNSLSAAEVCQNILRIRENISTAAAQSGRSPEEITVMAVTKTVPWETVNAAIGCGITLLGENRAQELLEKFPHYTLGRENIHFIGHLQTNKVRQIYDKVSMVESLDSLELAKELDKYAARLDAPMDVLLEVNIGKEETKSGIMPEHCLEMTKKLTDFSHLRLRGLMTIPPPGKNTVFFAKMQQLFVDITAKNRDNSTMNILSMGMSSDYEDAVRYGATIVRIGTAMFGRRNY